MSDERVSYYALLALGRTRENPSGLVRRTHTDPPVDEVLHRDLTWHPTEYLTLYRLGLNDNDHVEITKDEVNAILDRVRATGPLQDAADPERSQ
jgi:hypothetical protein